MSRRRPPTRTVPSPVAPVPIGRRQLVLGAAGAIVAVSGCGGGGAPSPQAPSLEIRSDLAGEARGPFWVNFYFSAPVFLPGGALAFSLSGGSVVAGSFRQTDARSAVVQIRPNAGSRGLVSLQVPTGAFADATGVAYNRQAVSFAQPYDTLPPLATLSFAGPVNALGFITGAGDFDLVFSRALDEPLTASPLQWSVGLVSDFRRLSAPGQPDAYRLAYLPPPATTGSLVVDLPPGSVRAEGIANDADYWSFGLATP